MNYQKVQKIPKKIQAGMNKMLSEKPQRRPNINQNFVSQQNFDVLKLYKINQKLSARAAAQPRMDQEDRLAYIREQKARLGMDQFLLKSSKRAVVDAQLKSSMPALEFDGFYRHVHGQHVFQPHEMHWSTFEFNKEANIAEMERLQEKRCEEHIKGGIQKAVDWQLALEKVTKE